MSDVTKPALSDGLTIVVKHDCETCQTIEPVLQALSARADVEVVVQDDPTFPTGVDDVVHDSDLAFSWHHRIETVPTLINAADGEEVERTVGWDRAEWQRITGAQELGAGLPDMRPGCGSLSVDPAMIDGLRARHGGSVLKARRVELADAEDDIEAMFARGWSDGLPVVPPTEERVLKMLTGTTRPPDEVVATVPPDLVEVTVEKVAIAAVMAGCLPEYLPWVLTAIEAACTDEFNMHGLLATTMPVGPVVICSGPGTRAIGMNSGGNAMGQGNRANSTIGRALQLIVRNVGGGRPGEVDRAAHGGPGKLSFCFAENDLESPYGTLAGQLGLPGAVDAVTVFSGEGPRCVVDQLSRDPESLARSLAASLQALHHPKLAIAFDAILVMGPEHARVFADAGMDRDAILTLISSHLNRPGADMVRGADGMAEGLPGVADVPAVPKFRAGGLLLAYAGGGAGLFSQIIGGWVSGPGGSEPVCREVRY